MRYKRRETVVSEVDSRKTCDGCGAEIRPADFYDGTEITIEARVGSVYPTGDSRRVEEIDACLACWNGKIVPALAALGFVGHSRDADEDGRVLEGGGT